MVIIRLYRVFYISYYINTVITSYNTSSYFDLKRGLKRKIEERSSKVCKAKQASLDISNSIKNLSAKVSMLEKETDDLFYDHIVEEYINDKMMYEAVHQDIDTRGEEDKNKDQIIAELVAEMVRDERNFIPSNSQQHNDIPNHIEDKEMSLLNKHTKTINESSLAVLDSEQNLIQQQQDNVYSYSNSLFLNKFLNFPSPSFTAKSIQVRFGSGLLNFLSADQLIRVLVTLLSKDLELTIAERWELVEMIFGHIDFSSKMKFNNNQIVRIVAALLASDVPNCFEQVFLTWKMWKVFTTDEQERMLEGVVFNISQMDKTNMRYEKETLVMLYLFVLNKEMVNSNVCEIFKNLIIKMYEKTHIFDDGNILNTNEYVRNCLVCSDTLNTSLLNLPKKFRFLSKVDMNRFRNSVSQHINIAQRYSCLNYFGKRYKIHICYVFTKFTSEDTQSNNEGVTDIYGMVFFEPKYIRSVFRKWAEITIKDSHLVDKDEVNEFRTAYGAMRQIVQSKGYNAAAFLKLFHVICVSNTLDRTFALILFNLTKEDILSDVSKTPEWIKNMYIRNTKSHRFIYIENIFMCNVGLGLKLAPPCYPINYFERIDDILLSLTNMNKKLYRECYLYQQLLFHPKFKIFTDSMLKSYVFGLYRTGNFNNKEKRVQVVRDLLFSEYYYESAMKLKFELIESEGNLKEFEVAFKEECKRYKNKTAIENERTALKNC